MPLRVGAEGLEGSCSSFVMTPDFLGPQAAHRELFVGRGLRVEGRSEGASVQTGPREGLFMQEGGPGVAIPWTDVTVRAEGTGPLRGGSGWDCGGRRPARGLCTEGGARAPAERRAGRGRAVGGARLGGGKPRGRAGGRSGCLQQQWADSRGRLEPD